MEETQPQCGVQLLPPSPNWFSPGAVDSRAEDRLLVTAAFKTIVIYRVEIGVKLPTLLKSLHGNCKVLHVRLYPSCSHERHGSSLLVTNEYGAVTLHNLNTGVAVRQHAQHKSGTIGAVCWSVLSTGEVYAVSVGSGGCMVVWDVEADLTRTHTLTFNTHSHYQHRGQQKQPQQHQQQGHLPTLAAVEAVPGGDGQLLVAADKVILVVDVKSGSILSQLRGHDQPVYCLRWHRGPGDTPVMGVAGSSRGGGSSSNNWRSRQPAVDVIREISSSTTEAASTQDQSSTTSADTTTTTTTTAPDVSDKNGTDGGAGGPYFASSDMGRNVLVWDLKAHRYVARTTVGGPVVAKKTTYSRGSRAAQHHIALDWHEHRLLASSPYGELLSITLFANNTHGSSRGGENNSSSSGDKSSTSKTDNNTTTSLKTTPTSSSSNGSAAEEGGGSSGVAVSGGGCSVTTVTLHREHSRVVYNINVVGSLVITSSQDRVVMGYCLDNNRVFFTIPTLGAAVNSIAFCPQDASWMTLGFQDNCIKLVNLHSMPPMRNKTIYSTIKGKVLALSWHPKEEGKILFGTGDGQVGIADANNMRVCTFSYFHQKPVYKVEWAPAVLPEQFPDLSKSLVAYSFGDRDIVMRNPSAHMADPVKLNSVTSHLPKDISEFSFSTDYKFLAVGCLDGSVSVLLSRDLTVLVKLVVVRKTIQHLLWQPLKSSKDQAGQYNLAVASGENKICIMELSAVLKEQMEKLSSARDNPLADEGQSSRDGSEKEATETKSFEPVILSSSTRELSGHASRVVFLSFSPHNPNLLASASYDHTCQVWDVNVGEPVGNYRGHLTRVFRVEFSPNEAGLVYSFGEENSLHQWRVADLKHKTPPEKILRTTDAKSKSVSGQEINGTDSKRGGVESRRALGATETKSRSSPPASETTVGESSSSKKTSDGSRRTPSHKSLFPLLHSASCHKRGFSLMSILCLNEQRKIEEEQKRKEEEKSLDDLLDGEDGDNDSSAPPAPSSAAQHYPQVLSRVGGALLEEAELQTPPPASDIATLLEFYGAPQQLAAFLKKQIAQHDASACSTSTSSLGGGAVLQCWQGSMERAVRAAIAAKTLTADMVALTPQMSYQLWEVASEAYATQLADAGDPLLAATYLLNAKKVTEAVQLLVRHKLHREALALAKCRLPYNTDLHRSVTEAFAATAAYEGNVDLAALLFSSLGNPIAAASALSRRGDTSSLLVAGLLYRSAADAAGGGHALAAPTLLDALKCAGAKQQLDKVATMLPLMPEHEWFGLIKTTQHVLTSLVEAAKAAALLAPTAADAASRFLVADTDGSHVPAVDHILALWRSPGHTPAPLADLQKWGSLRESVTRHLSTQQKPLTLKQFWYLTSVEITKMLLSLISASSSENHPSSTSTSDSTTTSTTAAPDSTAPDGLVSEAAAQLSAVLQLSADWGRPEEAYEVTHLLLPRGPSSVPASLRPLLPTPPASQLTVLYAVTEGLAQLVASSTNEAASAGDDNNATVPPDAGDTDTSPAATDNSAPVADNSPAVTDNSPSVADSGDATTEISNKSVVESSAVAKSVSSEPVKYSTLIRELRGIVKPVLEAHENLMPVVKSQTVLVKEKLGGFENPASFLQDVIKEITRNDLLDKSLCDKFKEALCLE